MRLRLPGRSVICRPEVFYYDKMKVADLLKYSASFYKKDCTKRIKELAEYMDLDLKRRIDDLSFGNKKKVGILQGLIHEPKLIILDEPTSGLDPLMQQKFFELLRLENPEGRDNPALITCARRSAAALRARRDYQGRPDYQAGENE